MRFHPTTSEFLLWQAIRGKRLGVAFKRQQVIGNFIVDFLARQAMLIVEIDGDVYHQRRVHADAVRERKLEQAGYRVLRLPASLVEREPLRAVGLVQQAVDSFDNS